MHPDSLDGLTATTHTWTNNGAQPATKLDERRGIHLLSPEDLVRIGDAFWMVTAVELSTQSDRSVVEIAPCGARTPSDACRVPLTLIEGCPVYLRAKRSQP